MLMLLISLVIGRISDKWASSYSRHTLKPQSNVRSVGRSLASPIAAVAVPHCLRLMVVVGEVEEEEDDDGDK